MSMSKVITFDSSFWAGASWQTVGRTWFTKELGVLACGKTSNSCASFWKWSAIDIFLRLNTNIIFLFCLTSHLSIGTVATEQEYNRKKLKCEFWSKKTQFTEEWIFTYKTLSTVLHNAFSRPLNIQRNFQTKKFIITK